MNKKFYSLIAAAMLSVSAFAQDGYSLTITDVKADKGTTDLELEVEMKNADVITLAQADFFLPTGLSFVEEDGELVVDVTSRDKKHTITLTPQTKIQDDFNDTYKTKATELITKGYPYAVRFLAMSMTNKTMTGNEGSIATIPVKAAADGTYAIEIWTQCLVNPSEQAFGQGWTTATVTVGDGTGINGVVEAKENGAVYNLNGQRVNKAQKGIFIQNGKKVATK